MSIAMIAAVAENGVIGNGKTMLPWHLRRDIKHFQDVTMGHPIVMGKKTFISIGCRALPGRKTYVLTRNPSEMAALYPHVTFTDSVDEILDLAKILPKIFICGGSEVYYLFLDHADMLYITHIYAEIYGDVVFPKIDENYWTPSSKGEVSLPDKENDHAMAFYIYTRKTPAQNLVLNS